MYRRLVRRVLPKRLRALIVFMRRRKYKSFSGETLSQDFLRCGLFCLREDTNTLKPNSHSILKKACRFYGNNVTMFPDSWWRNLAFAISTPDSGSQSCQDELIGSIKALPEDVGTSGDFLQLYTFALRFGLFNIGNELRDRATRAAVRDGVSVENLNRGAYRRGLAALIEVGHYREAAQVYNANHHRLGAEHRWCSTFLLNRLDNTQEQNTRVVFNDPLSEIDQDYKAFLANKRVAIVGPAISKQELGKEIDGHDIVIRCNYRKQNNLGDPKVKGTRCDVSYMSVRQVVQHVAISETSSLPEDVDWFVCRRGGMNRNASSMIERKLLAVGSKSKVREIVPLDEGLFNGRFNMIQTIVGDVLRFNPSSVKVYHADLMLTEGRHAGYYPDDWSMDQKLKKIFVADSAKKHDPVTQYWFLSRLFEKGLISGDGRFEKVLSIGVNQYMKELQEAYGDYGRIIDSMFYDYSADDNYREVRVEAKRPQVFFL